MVKRNKKIDDLYDILSSLSNQKKEYLTAEGQAFIDGMYLAGHVPEFVPLEIHHETLAELKHIYEVAEDWKKKAERPWYKRLFQD